MAFKTSLFSFACWALLFLDFPVFGQVKTGTTFKAEECYLKGNQLLKTKPEASLNYLKGAQLIYRDLKLHDKEVDCILALAEAYIRISDYDVAYSLLTNASSLSLDYELVGQRILALASLARVLSYMNESRRAEEMLEEAIELSGRFGQIQSKSVLEAQLAYLKLYYGQEMDPKNVAIIEKSLAKAKTAPVDSMALLPLLNYLGGAYFLVNNDPVRSGEMYQLALEMAQFQGDDWRFSLISNNYGDMLRKSGQLEKAEAIFTRSLLAAQKVNAKLLIYNCFRHLSSCAEDKGNYQLALKYYRDYESLKGEVLNETLLTKTRQVHSLYQMELKAKEAEKLKGTKKLEEEQLGNRLFLYQILIVVFLFILGGVLIFYYQNRKTLNASLSQNAVIEEQFRKMQEMNQTLFKEREAANQARHETEIAVKEKIDFLSIITHEIKTPLNAVVGTVQILKEEALNHEQNQSLDILKFSADNLMNLINDILDFNRIEAGKVELELKPFNLKMLMKNVVNSLIFKSDEKGLELKLKLDKDLPQTFIGDRLRLSQVLYNLISNAVKFTNKGFVEVMVKYYPGNKIGNLNITIKDSGIGMSEEQQKKIFGFFSQADASISRRFGGSGLGLTITKNLLQLMETKLSIHSKLGQGTTFEFWLQMEVGKVEMQVENNNQKVLQEKNLHKINMLFVEDVEFNRIVAGRFFKKWGIPYDTAENAEIALEKAESKPYDLILLDLQLPDMSGFDLAKAIRKLPIHAKTPILAMTASDYSDVKAGLKEAGMDGFIPKPFLADDLKEILSRYIPKAKNQAFQ